MRRVIHIDQFTKCEAIETMCFVKGPIDQTVIVCHTSDDLTSLIEALQDQQRQLREDEHSRAERATDD